jgi:hypothetical protein
VSVFWIEVLNRSLGQMFGRAFDEKLRDFIFRVESVVWESKAKR